MITNCPNCGAVIDPWKRKCDYCGTTYFDFTTIKTDEPFYIRIKNGDNTFTALVSMESMSIDKELSWHDPYIIYDNVWPYEVANLTLDLNMILHVVPDSNTGSLYKIEKNGN